MTEVLNSIGSAFGFVFLILLSVFIYFLPTIVAQGKKNLNSICLLNVFLGWTLLGWVIALIWAAAKDS